MICVHCKKEIEKNTKRFMVAIDRPYINLFFHWDCYTEIRGDLNQNLPQLVDMWYNYNRGTGKNENKSIKRRRKSVRTT